MSIHNSVFRKEAIDALKVKKGGQYIDATYGSGGHTKEIISRGGKVLCIDLHPITEEQEVIKGNFADIVEIALKQKIRSCDGILFDFGLSMDELRNAKLGLSYEAQDEKLDMNLSGGEGITASEILNTATQEALADIFMRYGEEKDGEKIASMIVKMRVNQKMVTVKDLLKAIDATHKNGSNFFSTYARIFQALRIFINEEFKTIPQALSEALSILKIGGVIVTITFHSIEDRWVKRFIKANQDKLVAERVDVSKIRKLMKYERSATLRSIKKIS